MPERTKICRDCLLQKPSSEFYTVTTDHGEYVRSYCKLCHKARNRERYRRERAGDEPLHHARARLAKFDYDDLEPELTFLASMFRTLAHEIAKTLRDQPVTLNQIFTVLLEARYEAIKGVRTTFPTDRRLTCLKKNNPSRR